VWVLGGDIAGKFFAQVLEQAPRARRVFNAEIVTARRQGPACLCWRGFLVADRLFSFSKTRSPDFASISPTLTG
jgi:hypothetical protein